MVDFVNLRESRYLDIGAPFKRDIEIFWMTKTDRMGINAGGNLFDAGNWVSLEAERELAYRKYRNVMNNYSRLTNNAIGRFALSWKISKYIGRAQNWKPIINVCHSISDVARCNFLWPNKISFDNHIIRDKCLNMIGRYFMITNGQIEEIF